MSEDVYFRLGERQNEYNKKTLLVEPYLKILREFYTEEQATLGSEFPVGAFTADELAEKLNRDKGPLVDLLEDMADNGLMFVTKTEKGISRYALTQFVPGVVEFQLMRGRDTPKDRKVAKMIEEFFEGEMADLMAAVLSDPEMVKEMVPVAPARIITVEKELPQETEEICSYERLTEMLATEESFAAAKCYCRHHAHLVDRPCEIEGVPEYSCLMFGKAADYLIDRGFGKRITREEAEEILRATEEAGLVHNLGNYSDRAVFVCNCCGCCCQFLSSLKKFQNQAVLAFSNFVVAIDEESCTGCGDCTERCQLEALSVENELATLNENICVGCGNCVTVCPTESLAMVRRANVEPPESGDDMALMGM
jgi:NAD-dependent dihydropyrimidine dehydrogenase PreA subunit